MRIEEILTVGERNAVSLRHLAKVLQVTEREVRRMVLRARCEGVPILSSNQGYFLPEDESEILRFVRARLKAIRTSAAAIHFLQRRLKEREQ